MTVFEGKRISSENIDQVLAEMRQMLVESRSPEEARRLLQLAGIVDENGDLVEFYRN